MKGGSKKRKNREDIHCVRCRLPNFGKRLGSIVSILSKIKEVSGFGFLSTKRFGFFLSKKSRFRSARKKTQICISFRLNLS